MTDAEGGGQRPEAGASESELNGQVSRSNPSPKPKVTTFTPGPPQSREVLASLAGNRGAAQPTTELQKRYDTPEFQKAYAETEGQEPPTLEPVATTEPTDAQPERDLVAELRKDASQILGGDKDGWHSTAVLECRAADELAALRAARDTLSACYTDADAKCDDLTAKCERLSDNLKIRTAELQRWNEIFRERETALEAKLDKAVAALSEVMVERVAKALFKREADLYDKGKPTWEDAPQHEREDYLENARVALEARKEGV